MANDELLLGRRRELRNALMSATSTSLVALIIYDTASRQWIVWIAVALMLVAWERVLRRWRSVRAAVQGSVDEASESNERK